MSRLAVPFRVPAEILRNDKFVYYRKGLELHLEICLGVDDEWN
jgi:hypothetical protein